MNTSDGIHMESDLKKQLRDVAACTQTGEYEKALTATRSAKESHPRNIFIIALEKQLEKILALTSDPNLSDPARLEELIASIPTLVAKAVEGMEAEPPATPQQPVEGSAEREAAFTKLKNEYFKLADGYVKAGKYSHALQEIKRVLILDPDNTMAEEYQKKIQDLVDLKERSGEQQSPPPPDERPPVVPPVHTQKAAPAAKPQPRDTTPRTTTTEERTKKRPPQKRRSRTNQFLIVGASAVAMVSIALYLTKNQDAAGSASVQTKRVVSNANAEGIELPPTPTNAATSQAEVPAEPAADIAVGQPALLKSEGSAGSIESDGQESAGVKSREPKVAPPVKPESSAGSMEPLVDRHALLVRLANPTFPEAARQAGLQGDVLVAVQINPNGKPVRTRILKSTSAVFNSAAIEAVMQSQYSARVETGKPVASWLTVPFSFKLKNN